MDTKELAIEMLSEVHKALARGTKHYSKDGVFLATDKEIIEALLRDGEITFEPARVA